MQYVFLDVCHIQIITYFYGRYIVLETLGPWCLSNNKFVVPRENLERQRLKMLFFSPLMTTVELYLKNYINREVINILEQLNDQIHEALATVVPNMLRLARENLIKRARLKEYSDERSVIRSKMRHLVKCKLLVLSPLFSTATLFDKLAGIFEFPLLLFSVYGIGFWRLANMLEELHKVEIEKLLKIKTDFLSFSLYVSVLPQHETS
ncbi:hypothetical protein GEV33_003264 [Tenebrio molitor]|uniref:Uncharacterized protein n=1 Tax=Tenebrio molitor TaxID=7067 RepID=A0A8J6HRW9_TENMO|nr:hypothetical protein GEV33_003264 [Tenebrio molitor]